MKNRGQFGQRAPEFDRRARSASGDSVKRQLALAFGRGRAYGRGSWQGDCRAVRKNVVKQLSKFTTDEDFQKGVEFLRGLRDNEDNRQGVRLEAAKLLMEYHAGKPAQRVQHETEGGGVIALLMQARGASEDHQRRIANEVIDGLVAVPDESGNGSLALPGRSDGGSGDGSQDPQGSAGESGVAEGDSGAGAGEP